MWRRVVCVWCLAAVCARCLVGPYHRWWQPDPAGAEALQRARRSAAARWLRGAPDLSPRGGPCIGFLATAPRYGDPILAAVHSAFLGAPPNVTAVVHVRGPSNHNVTAALRRTGMTVLEAGPKRFENSNTEDYRALLDACRRTGARYSVLLDEDVWVRPPFWAALAEAERRLQGSPWVVQGFLTGRWLGWEWSRRTAGELLSVAVAGYGVGTALGAPLAGAGAAVWVAWTVGRQRFGFDAATRAGLVRTDGLALDSMFTTQCIAWSAAAAGSNASLTEDAATQNADTYMQGWLRRHGAAEQWLWLPCLVDHVGFRSTIDHGWRSGVVGAGTLSATELRAHTYAVM